MTSRADTMSKTEQNPFSAESVAAHLQRSARVKDAAAKECAAAAFEAAEAIAGCLGRGGKLMLCGNGGSAADAQHIAAEFVARLDSRWEREGLAALALTTDTSFITAYSNDTGFEGIFARQVDALGRKGDVLLGLSTSGNSANVVAAFKAAKVMGITTVALTGSDGGKLGKSADIAVKAPSDETPLVQETHIALGHAITAGVESLLGYRTDRAGKGR